MKEELFNTSEVSLPEKDVIEIIERVQGRRGDILSGINKLSAGKGKYIKIFIATINNDVFGTIISTLNSVADGDRSGNADSGQYIKEEWGDNGLLEVDNFDLQTILDKIAAYEEQMSGVKGKVNTVRVGILDLTSPDGILIKVGEVNTDEETITVAKINKRNI